MAEVHFYHLESLNLEAALPQLLEKCLQRGWRAVVRAGSPERVEALAGHLWEYDRESFLPHGTVQDGHAEEQPIWLTDGADNPNDATVLFLVDGAAAGSLEGYARVCDLFDGSDPDALAEARERWKQAKASGARLLYWRHGPDGWQNKAGA